MTAILGIWPFHHEGAIEQTMNLQPHSDDFEQAAKDRTRPTLLGEFWEFLGQNRKWWLLPILIVLLVFGVFIFLAGTGAAPFIYTFH